MKERLCRLKRELGGFRSGADAMRAEHGTVTIGPMQQPPALLADYDAHAERHAERHAVLTGRLQALRGRYHALTQESAMSVVNTARQSMRLSVGGGGMAGMGMTPQARAGTADSRGGSPPPRRAGRCSGSTRSTCEGRWAAEGVGEPNARCDPASRPGIRVVLQNAWVRRSSTHAGCAAAPFLRIFVDGALESSTLSTICVCESGAGLTAGGESSKHCFRSLSKQGRVWPQIKRFQRIV